MKPAQMEDFTVGKLNTMFEEAQDQIMDLEQHSDKMKADISRLCQMIFKLDIAHIKHNDDVVKELIGEAGVIFRQYNKA
jgi:hypothetical protein